MFRSIPQERTFHLQFSLDFLILQYGTDRFSRNVGNYNLCFVASHKSEHFIYNSPWTSWSFYMGWIGCPETSATNNLCFVASHKSEHFIYNSPWTSWSFNMGRIGCPETSVTTNVRCVPARDSKYLTHTAAKAWNHLVWLIYEHGRNLILLNISTILQT
jgi:uncharacterized membrane protein YkgB